ncbi:sigma-70 family RNA polymerase sigma factor [Microbacterium sp. HD4P20]|uniref:RNA polymerase sigma factor n=1 Tax=Microbacterium sp. HD4P20 TaxID=2864874 RepID=UPI001C642CDF|nr:sigma-70 family RNA polymerase sigma factor [Microbacterium sp. HD4P20]MCP2635530.1 sigma-70 family RNA polymerase sigma factor [Microbacterium sp. HD4P20]
MRRVRPSGRDAHFERCIEANGPDILRYLQRRATDQGDAADTYGETLLTAWRARGRMPREEAASRMWLFVVARNTLLNSRRGDRRRSAAVTRLSERIAIQASDAETDTAVELRLAISRLPAELSEIIRLTYWDGFSSAEVAQILGLNASTVRTRLSQARAQLRTELALWDDPIATD